MALLEAVNPFIVPIITAPATEISIKKTWRLLGLSFRKTALKSMVIMGTHESSVPLSDALVNRTPRVSIIKYSTG